MTDKKGYVRKREQRWHQLCRTDWDWRRGERRKASRLQELSAALATVAGAERVRAEYVWERRRRVCSLQQIFVEYLAHHLEIYFLAVCDHRFQVYPPRLCQELQMLSSWGGLSSLTCYQSLCFLMSTNCHAHGCHQETNTGFCSTDLLLMRDMYPKRESFNKCTRRLQQLKFILCFSCYHTWCII